MHSLDVNVAFAFFSREGEGATCESETTFFSMSSHERSIGLHGRVFLTVSPFLRAELGRIRKTTAIF